MADKRTVRPVATAGIVLGIGLGGFFDGIFLHQIWQVHAMLSVKLPLHTMENMKANMTADGVFHAVVLLATLIGIILLFNAAKRSDIIFSDRVFYGAMLAGWGIFNVVEGIIDHHILEVHHVVERLGQSMWDWLFLGGSAVLIAIGWAIAKGNPDKRR
jgi:uncharacterized membrane protein